VNEAVTYPYAQGDLLDDRHTYQYSPYQGAPFLRAWRAQREVVGAEWAEPIAPPPAARTFEPKRNPPFRTEERLEGMMDGVRRGLWSDRDFAEEYKTWIKKFEVTKRLFKEYDARFRAIDKTAFRELGLYLRFAEVMEAAYRSVEDVPALNALLKVNDTLIACRRHLPREHGQRLAWLIKAEIGHVEALARNRSVTL